MVTIYRDAGFAGTYARLARGDYRNRALETCDRSGGGCEAAADEISSIRVEANTLAVVADSSGGGFSANSATRVVTGPAEIADLGALGLDDRVSYVGVVPFRAYDSGTPPPDGGVTLHTGYGGSGRRAVLHRGDYSAARLGGVETGLAPADVRSVTVAAGCIAVLGTGAPGEQNANAVLVRGPGSVEIDDLGFDGDLLSVRVLYDTPVAGPATYASSPGPVSFDLGVSRVAGGHQRRRVYARAGAKSVPPAPAPAPVASGARVWWLLLVLICVLAVLFGVSIAGVLPKWTGLNRRFTGTAS